MRQKMAVANQDINAGRAAERHGMTAFNDFPRFEPGMNGGSRKPVAQDSRTKRRARRTINGFLATKGLGQCGIDIIFLSDASPGRRVRVELLQPPRIPIPDLWGMERHCLPIRWLAAGPETG